MDDFRKKTILVCAAIAAFMVAFLFYVWFQPEAFRNAETEPVGMDEIEADPTKSYAGRTAGEDIPLIASAAAFEELWEGDYVTVSPKSVVRTGIYGRKPWVKASNYSGRRRRKREIIDDMSGLLAYGAEDYREYCLIELEDSSYILAQLTVPHQRAIAKGDTAVMPIGEKKTSGRASAALEEICGEYDAESGCLLYMVDDEWDESHSFTLFIVRYGAAGVGFFIVAIPLFMAASKIFRIPF